MNIIVNTFIYLFFIISVILSFKYKFIHLKFFNKSIRILKDSIKKKDNRYKAFLLSLGNHIGAGNIVGVCSALLIGGAGSLFWMNICLFFTSIYALIENSLGLKFNSLIDGEYRGGAPYYIFKGLKNKKLSYCFALILLFSSIIFFLPIQINSFKTSFKCLININDSIIFIILCIFIFIFLFPSTKRLLNINDILVTVMTIIFMIICIIILIINNEKIIQSLLYIVSSAFNDLNINTIIGSFVGGSISIGFRRSIFSNEAGLGTAPTFNSMVNNDPINQGFLQIFACFIDTTVMCTLFGLVILVSVDDIFLYNSPTLAITTFQKGLKLDNGIFIGSLFLLVFSLGTIIGSYYSGLTNILFFNKDKNINKIKILYKFLFIIFIYFGIIINNNVLWNLVDYGMIILGTINIYVLLKLDYKFKEMIFSI